MTDADKAAAPRRLLGEALARAQSVAVARQTAPIDPATRERLRALGYIPDDPATADAAP